MNCTSCTFVLENDTCQMCFSDQTHKWNYVNDVDGDTTYQTPYTREIVSRASTIIQLGVSHLVNKRFVFCLTRPPGHHACENRRTGFCHKNFAIEALDGLYKQGKTAIILDIDAHHGDGSEEELLKRDYGFYISLHGYGKHVYPGTGNTNCQNTLNLPLNSNATDKEWFEQYKYAEEKIKSINPDVTILTCGLDGYYKDSIAPLQLSEKFYGQFGKKLASLDIPVLSILEGGYYVEDLGILCSDFIKGFVNTN